LNPARLPIPPLEQKRLQNYKNNYDKQLKIVAFILFQFK